MEITTQNNSEKELRQKKIVEGILGKYPVPVITDKIIIEEGVVPHSHPVLTLNTRTDNELPVLQSLAHEQFHWFAQNNGNYDDCIRFLKENYPDLGDCNTFGNYPNSFWEHLIVCWNTRNFLQKNLRGDEFNFIYSQWQPYPLTEKFVEENFERLHVNLANFSMIY